MPKPSNIYLFLGLALVVASINPFSLQISSSQEVAKFSFDMTLVWGAGLIGIWLAKVIYSKGGRLGSSFLDFNYRTRGLFLSWLIGGSIVTFWYIPGPFALSVVSPSIRALQLITFIIAGLVSGIGWDGMPKVWKSITIFAVFSMMATMAEVFLEMGTYYAVDVYRPYSVSQLVETSYFLFAMAFIPSTYYMVKILRDLDIF
ncbi:DUF1404 domain-containing protein [Metallosphaera tengchongensis]|uniref:DUF1404 domain-containing protein n=1 Tax=Metallosphaera tengchongensis TaxID=1532350 RepID=A0A6N0NTU2_9CREN|nr:DUF1404 domain-containing protein [Metallosphaera tengchongensis]QKR00112.1 DUF1404 domain-containing protein [Metallosphaera tengchongensis]